jgi:hypothetical protein
MSDPIGILIFGAMRAEAAVMVFRVSGCDAQVASAPSRSSRPCLLLSDQAQ